MNQKELLEKQFYRIRISEDDFREATGYLKDYNKHVFNNTNKALLSMAIICYSRPFIKSNDAIGKGRSILNVNINNVYNDKEIKLHKYIVALRNKAIAHSDFEIRPLKLIKSERTGFVIGGKYIDIQSETIDVGMFIKMCEKMIKYSFGKLSSINNKLQLL